MNGLRVTGIELAHKGGNEFDEAAIYREGYRIADVYADLDMSLAVPNRGGAYSSPMSSMVAEGAEGRLAGCLAAENQAATRSPAEAGGGAAGGERWRRRLVA